MYNSCTRSKRGALAQLGARIAGSDEVTGSSPVCSTIENTEVIDLFFCCITCYNDSENGRLLVTKCIGIIILHIIHG